MTTTLCLSPSTDDPFSSFVGAIEGNEPLTIGYMLHHLNSEDSICKEDLDSEHSNGLAPLHIACQAGYFKIARILIEFGCKVDIKCSKNGNTPLHYAVQKDSLRIVQLLLLNGADPLVQNMQGDSPLHLCATVTMFQMVCAACRNLNAKTNTGNTVLMNAKNNNGNTVLINAIELGREQELLSMHSRGEITELNINEKNLAGDSALLLALKTRNKNLVQVLKKLGATTIRLRTTLHDFCMDGKFTEVEKLLKDPNSHYMIEMEDPSGTTALVYASRYLEPVYFQICKFLVEEHKANINTRNNEGWTPLTAAVQQQNLELMDYLLERGARMDYYIVRRAARHAADLTVLKKLIQYGIPADLPNLPSVLEEQIKEDRADAFRLLADTGVSLEPFVTSVSQGSPKCFSLLQEAKRFEMEDGKELVAISLRSLEKQCEQLSGKPVQIEYLSEKQEFVLFDDFTKAHENRTKIRLK